jgi:hypothetical protein
VRYYAEPLLFIWLVVSIGLLFVVFHFFGDNFFSALLWMVLWLGWGLLFLRVTRDVQ